MTDPALAVDDTGLIPVLRDILQRELEQGATKRNALRIALDWAINSGQLPPGSKLPPETQLAQVLGVSLGTVQAALRQVQDLGAIVRRRGDGTRVTPGTQISSAIWHFRMYHTGTGEPFRILNQEIEVLQSTQRGPWVEHLGERPYYLALRRRIEGTDDVVIGAEMMLDPELVPPHSIDASELRLTNLRTMLEQKLKIKAGHAKHRVRLTQIDPRKLATFGMALDQTVLHVEARTFLNDERPFYFQTLYVPADRIELEF